MAKYLSRLVLVSAISALLGADINNAYAQTTIAPSITTQPVNKTVTATTKASFTIAATGAPTPNIPMDARDTRCQHIYGDHRSNKLQLYNTGNNISQ